MGLGAAYDLLVGAPFIPFVIGIFGLPLGAMCGAIAGLPLGLLEGVVLGMVTVLRYRGGAHEDSLRYQRSAKLACTVACMLAVASFWGIVFWRADDSVSVQLACTRDLPETLIMIIGPSPVATGAAWWAGRKVSIQLEHAVGKQKA